MRRFIRLYSGPLVLLSIVAALALGTYVLQKIIRRLPATENPGDTAGNGGCCPACDSVDIPAGTGEAPAEKTADNDTAAGSFEQPPSGAVFTCPSSGCVAPLSVEISGPDNYYLYLKRIDSRLDTGADGSADIGFYAAAGSSVSLDIPVGSYRLVYAVGGQWRGLGERFGPDTRYYRAEEPLAFYIEGNCLHGNTVRLFPPAEDASPFHRIDAADFPG